MRLFPYLLTRIGGGSFDQLCQVDHSPLTAEVQGLLALKAEKKCLKQHLCDHLRHCLQALPDQKSQNQVQNVRRDIYNERPVKPQALAHARLQLSEALLRELETYLVFAAGLEAAAQKAAASYEQVLLASRRQLQQLARDEYLQKGLVLSSQSLRNVLDDYSSQHPACFRKKEFQIEQSLLKYLTRMYTKTSPFSTFNNLALGRPTSLPVEAIRADAATDANGPVTGHIRLNNYLLRYLKELFTASRDVHRHLLVRPNPTVAEKDDHFIYLTNHHNVEAFQRIGASPVLSLLWQLARQHTAGIRFATLAEQAGQYVEAPAENIEQYLRQLISYGFLEFDLEVSGTDPDWDLKLRATLHYLENKQVAHMAELSQTLRHIRQLADQYGQSPVEERQQILHEVYHAFRDTCMKLHEKAGLPEMERRTPEELQAEWRSQQQAAREKKAAGQQAEEMVLVAEKEKAEAAGSGDKAFEHRSATYFGFKPEQLFYEDTVRQVALQLHEGKLQQLVQSLFDLLQELRFFRGDADERERMRHFFMHKYGSGARVSLLDFYEDFYREVKKPEAERLAKGLQEALTQAGKAPEHRLAGMAAGTENPQPKNNQDNSPLSRDKYHDQEKRKKITAWMQGLAAGLGEKAAGPQQQADLPLDLIRQVNQAVAGSKQELIPVSSYGAFLQLYQEQDENGEWQMKGVLNAATAGYGKMISRFLHLFPEAVTQAVKTWNQELQGDHRLFIENCDASYFNANLHPALMPYEIRMPGGHNNLPADHQLPISDFEVTLNEPAGEVQLLHKPSGKQGYVFDLGFQGHTGRSQLFQLLDKFTHAEYLSVYPVVSAVNTAAAGRQQESHPASERLTVLPRIVYENQLVLQRKTWYVPRQLIPLRQPGMSDWSYYLALNEWRKAQGMVDEVYVTISPNRQPTAGNPELTKKPGRDDYKPQYIHFNDPLLVLLLEKLQTKTPSALKIEEMLPDSRHLLQINKQRFVTEFVVQWYD
jgi:hypothetical protein